MHPNPHLQKFESLTKIGKPFTMGGVLVAFSKLGLLSANVHRSLLHVSFSIANYMFLTVPIARIQALPYRCEEFPIVPTIQGPLKNTLGPVQPAAAPTHCFQEVWNLLGSRLPPPSGL